MLCMQSGAAQSTAPPRGLTRCRAKMHAPPARLRGCRRMGQCADCQQSSALCLMLWRVQRPAAAPLVILLPCESSKQKNNGRKTPVIFFTFFESS
jgi:DTW domain-containing protein YfiP